MYMCQTVAYQARDKLGGTKTDSTLTAPPSHTPPDITALCELRKKVLSELPKTCAHCKAPLLHSIGSFVERPDGSLMAYCKGKGACGRSQVLFAPFDRSVP